MIWINAHCLCFSNAETFPETCFPGLCQILQWITSYSLCKFLYYRVRFSTYQDAHEPLIVASFKTLICWYQDTIKFGGKFPCWNAGTYPTTSSMDRCLIWRWHPQSKHCKLRLIGNLQFFFRTFVDHHYKSEPSIFLPHKPQAWCTNHSYVPSIIIWWSVNTTFI